MCKTEKTTTIVKLHTLLMFTLGLVGIFAAAYLAENMMPISGSLLSAFAASLTAISVSFIGLSIFNFALDSKNWRDYFSERIKEVIIENDYLNTLDQEILKEMQTRLLKAQFKNQAIDKEGSFLNYFHLHLHQFISNPYREDVSTEVLMQLHPDNSELFQVTDKVRYICRASGGKIQTHISWKPDEGEFKEVQSLKITIQFPLHHKDAGNKEVIYSREGDELKKDLEQGIKESLEKYQNIDYLVVTTESVYIVELGKFQYWQMAHSTKNFEITITYPSTCKIQFKTLVLENAVSQITESIGYLKFGYSSWALPYSGLAWLVSKNSITSLGDST